ncbi:MAG TPA: Sua5/YciO/YrdC/YwlC family protein [Spirochaetota bacterium]|nr:Sua5/YciO/YrdC/YwlC family protein [Spirochaetota bacterium]HPI89491.1 Sua5/YciO/YrdC/YwlC family protein [Spirochaetota bacterium]HPR49564.1 Sua5/YciO/YrdC/YwlC family protein [Spirochaetota bacterium]
MRTAHKKSEIIELKKLKKDGSLDSRVFRILSGALKKGQFVAIPVDGIYGMAASYDDDSLDTICKVTGQENHHIERLVSSFKMLDLIAEIDKLEFDFLHRIWPGEIVVRLEKHANRTQTVAVRMPKSKYVEDLINVIETPLYFTPGGGHVYKKNDVIKRFKDKCDYLVIINEFCKDHNEPSIVDISGGSLEILNEGRISAEEIKSLYFLGKDDISL